MFESLAKRCWERLQAHIYACISHVIDQAVARDVGLYRPIIGVSSGRESRASITSKRERLWLRFGGLLRE